MTAPTEDLSTPRAFGAWAVLVVEALTSREVALPLGEAALVGRDPALAIHLDDAQVSRLHARLDALPDRVLVRDLESRHGTTLNGAPIGREPVSAKDGDVLRVATTTLVVVQRGAPAGAGPTEVTRVDDGAAGLIVAEPRMRELFALVARLARTRVPVLVAGESGVGKEGVARTLHRLSPHAAGPFVAVNTAAMPDDLVESELFGHVRGAFSGAHRDKPGLFEAAHGGTLFLDEIGELAHRAQAKLLRVLDDGRVRRVGATQDRALEVRVVAATNRDLKSEVEAGRFRGDLYFRLAGALVRVPPLRERPRDIVAIAHDHLARTSPGRTLAPATLVALTRYAWPGNVRELRHALELAAASEHDPIGPGDLPVLTPATSAPVSDDIATAVHDLEREKMLEALAAEGGNQTRAAARIGMPRRTFITKMRRYGIPGRAR